MPSGATTTGTPDAQKPLPATCNVLGLVAFGPGYHKNQLYSPQMVDRIPANFRRLEGHTIPRAKIEGGQPGAKIGHDKEQLIAQRLKQSMGFLSVGKITRCDPLPGYPGYIVLDIRGVPTRAVGQEIAADRLPGTSVELIPELPDPNDPSQTIEGPILTGIAFLGEEQPAVRNWPAELRERARPKATFDDGSPVPANGDIPQEWLDAQSDVSQVMAARMGAEFSAETRTVKYRGREFADRTLCFSDISEVTTMDPKAQLAAAGLSPEQIEMVMGIMGGGAGAAPPPTTAAAPPPPPPDAGGGAGAGGGAPPPMPMSSDAMKRCMAWGTDPKATEDQKMMSAAFSEVSKQLGAVNKFAEDAQKSVVATKTAAFGAACEVEIAPLRTKLPPAFIDQVILPARDDIAKAATFGSESDRLTAFKTVTDRYKSLPDDPRLKATPRPVTAEGKPQLTAGNVETLNTEAYRRSAIGNAVRMQLLPKS